MLVVFFLTVNRGRAFCLRLFAVDVFELSFTSISQLTIGDRELRQALHLVISIASFILHFWVA